MKICRVIEMKWEHLRGADKWESFQAVYKNKFKLYCSAFRWGGKKRVYSLFIMGLENYPAFYYKNIVFTSSVGKKLLLKNAKRLLNMKLPDNPKGDYIPLAGKANGRTSKSKIVKSWVPKRRNRNDKNRRKTA